MNNNKSKITLLIMSALVVVILGGAYFLYQNREESIATFNSSNTISSANSESVTMTKFTSEEFGYSFEYPTDWWHNSVPYDALVQNPNSATHTLSLEEFGVGDYEDYKFPFSEDKLMLDMGVTVYTFQDGSSIDDVKYELGLNDAEIISTKVGEYDASIIIIDDSNHELQAARMYQESYFVQQGDYYYEIYFSALNKENLDQNRNTIESILSSFKLS